MRKIISLLLIISIVAVMFCSCGHEHSFGEWKTTKEASCKEEGTQERVCECGEKETQIIPISNEHSWKDATCDAPKTCSVCGATEGQALGHGWKEATCEKPKTCSVCGATEGNALGHKWTAATCTTAKKCSVCGKTEGTSLGHNIVNYICTRCKETFVTAQDMPNILDVTKLNTSKSGSYGLKLTVGLKNKSRTKTIKYMFLSFKFYDKNGNAIKNSETNTEYFTCSVYDTIRPSNTTSGSITYYLNSKNSQYNNKISIEVIGITYTDGTTLYINKSYIASGAVVSWR